MELVVRVEMEVIRPSQYFEGHSMHCPLLKAFNRFRFSSSRKNFARFVLFVVLVYFLLNINGISDWVKGLTQGQHQGERAFTYANFCTSLGSQDGEVPGNLPMRSWFIQRVMYILFIVP